MTTVPLTLTAAAGSGLDELTASLDQAAFIVAPLAAGVVALSALLQLRRKLTGGIYSRRFQIEQDDLRWATFTRKRTIVARASLVLTGIAIVAMVLMLNGGWPSGWVLWVTACMLACLVVGAFALPTQADRWLSREIPKKGLGAFIE